MISFACAGMRCPKCARRDTGADEEPFGNEALLVTRGLCLQREVDIEVESIDKTGTFLGRWHAHTLALPVPRMRVSPSIVLRYSYRWHRVASCPLCCSLFLPDKRNLAVVLLEQGLASLVPAAADRRCLL